MNSIVPVLLLLLLSVSSSLGYSAGFEGTCTLLPDADTPVISSAAAATQAAAIAASEAAAIAGSEAAAIAASEAAAIAALEAIAAAIAAVPPTCPIATPWTSSDIHHPTRLQDLESALGLQDDSIRCHVSGICDGYLSCPSKPPLCDAPQSAKPAAPHVDKTHLFSIPESCDSTDLRCTALKQAGEWMLNLLQPKEKPVAPNQCAGSPGCNSSQTDDLGCIFERKERKEKVRSAVKWAYGWYERCGWGLDELAPLTCQGYQSFDLGLTLVDSLDTLILAGLTEEAERATQWIRRHLNVAPASPVNLFETTIRVLGGLLSAFHLSKGDQTLLLPATELALRLLVAFDTPNGVPLSDVNLLNVTAASPQWTQYHTLSEMFTLSLENTYAAVVSQRPEMAEPALGLWRKLASMPGRMIGLAPVFVNAEAGSFVESEVITLGARGDSFYEYMLKQWIQAGGGQASLHSEMYASAMQGVRAHLLRETGCPHAGGLLFVGESYGADSNVTSRVVDSKMDHLACYLPGLLALGHLHGIETGQGDDLSDLELASELMSSCYQLYRHTPLGLAPEIVRFMTGGWNGINAGLKGVGGGYFDVSQQDSHSLLRPETVESLFIMWRVTKDPKYQDWGWNIFRAIEQHARLSFGGYASLESVLHDEATHSNKMESFFIAETLKYLFLLFEDDSVLPLDEYVFNTEAHPFPILGSKSEIAHRKWYLPSFVDSQNPTSTLFTRETILEEVVGYQHLRVLALKRLEKTRQQRPDRNSPANFLNNSE